MTAIHADALTADLDPLVLYGILRLRVDVFVVEQECAYPELDGRDLEPTTRQFWTVDDESVAGGAAAGGTAPVLATLRLLDDGDDERRIGRVATALDARGRGYAGVLLEHAVAAAGGRLIRLDAQARLEPWYARYGFARSGEDFLEDGIVHVPMTRPAG